MPFLLDGWHGSHHRLARLRRTLNGTIWPYDSSGHTDLETLGAALATTLRSHRTPFDVVAYSMGGLILREAMRQLPHLPLRRAVFLHTPHHGTLIARTLPLPAVRQMRPHSPFLRRLHQTPWTTPTLNVWCPGDLVVFPGANARWSHATVQITYLFPAHLGPLYDPWLHRRIRRFLHSPSPSNS